MPPLISLNFASRKGKCIDWTSATFLLPFLFSRFVFFMYFIVKLKQMLESLNGYFWNQLKFEKKNRNTFKEKGGFKSNCVHNLHILVNFPLLPAGLACCTFQRPLEKGPECCKTTCCFLQQTPSTPET